jgi:hypothetical protein
VAGGVKILLLLLCLLGNANMDGCEKMPFLASGRLEKPGCSKHVKSCPLLFMQFLTCLKKNSSKKTRK